MKLRPSLRAAGEEADERVADLDVAAEGADAEQLGEHARLALRLVGAEVELARAVRA